MLCPSCRRRVSRGAAACRSCGAALPGAPAPPLDLVLDDGTRVAVIGALTIGRAEGNDLQLADPSVSRHHARVVANGPGGASLEDVASSHGTWVDEERVGAAVPLRSGARIQVGDRFLVAEQRGTGGGAGHGETIVVPVGASLVLPAAGRAALETSDGERAGQRPRLRSGHRVKRVGGDADGAPAWWVIEDLQSGTVLRLDDTDGALLMTLDGERTLQDLIALAQRDQGAAGPGRLARLLMDLGERGLLSGVPPGRPAEPEPTGWRRLVRPRERATEGLGAAFDRAYRAGGWVLFTRPALVVLAAVALAGLVAECFLIGWRYGSPFVVASHLGLGGLVFLIARGLLVALHEAAHGLALAAHGRRVRRGGLRLIAIFPFVFVDTSEAWFEPRRNRLVITLAGPASDFVLGGAFAITCLALPEGTIRDIFFQVAFAAYVGALFNLNPFLDRDGYHVLVDVLGRPRLRERARAELARRLSGQGASDHDPALRRFAIAGVVWSVVAAAAAVGLSLWYAPTLRALVPDTVAWIVLATVWIALFIPVVATIGRPLLQRRSYA